MEDIAVIGLGCRFPGADNADEFWEVLVNGENHVVDIPADRWNNDLFYSDNKDEPGKHYVKKAGFISGNHEWDNKLFGVSDAEALQVDPQQRLVLECTHMALEDTGITWSQIRGTQTGVFIGVMNDDYKGLSFFEHDEDTNYTATGKSTTVIAARVSYVFDLRGPCMVLDTACSSSLVGIHLGAQAIRAGDCDMALCGGVSSILTPDMFTILCKARMLSPSGQCQTFCDKADGYARGEGCGIVLLKSYKKAVLDGNKVWGIVKTGTNQDGHTAQPITAPSGLQQEALLQKIYSQHNINPNELQYIEAHGTGTAIGDPTEVDALGRFVKSRQQKSPVKEDGDRQFLFSQETASCDGNDHSSSIFKMPDSRLKSPILIGSVKSNIGHLESAAGVASLIKVLLMMKNGKMVPTLHVSKDKSNVNKKIQLSDYNFDLALEVLDWQPNANKERIACVNCFSFGGSNSHAIIVQKLEPAQEMPVSRQEPIRTKPILVMPLTAMESASLKQSLEAVSEDLSTSKFEVEDMCSTAAFHREHFLYRTLLFGRNVNELKEDLALKLKHFDTTASTNNRNVIFVFCGVGTSWKGMCQEMMKTECVFRSTVEKIDGLLFPYTGWKISEKFSNETDFKGPVLNSISIFTVQVALFELWKFYGVQPNIIIGQSVGEVAASYASGALSLEDAVRIIYLRSKLLSKRTGGKMLVVRNLDIDKVEKLCESLDNRVTIAVYNSPSSCTLSGDADAVESIHSELNCMKNVKEDILLNPLSVECAYHSHHMDPCAKEIQTCLGTCSATRQTYRQISTVTGKFVKETEIQTGTYWAANIRQPVLFLDGIMLSIKENDMNIYLEIGPRPVVRAHLQNILGQSAQYVSLMSMNLNKEIDCFYSTLCALFKLGLDLTWSRIIPHSPSILPVPRYIFNRKKIMHLPPKNQQLLFTGKPEEVNRHMYVKTSSDSPELFLVHIGSNTTPFVYDHFLFNEIVAPGATWIEAAFEIGQQTTENCPCDIDISAEFLKPFMPRIGKEYILSFRLEENTQTGLDFQILDKKTVLCFGKISSRNKPERPIANISGLQRRMSDHLTQEQCYSCLQSLNFRYGDSLRLIQQGWVSVNECLAEILLPKSVQKQKKITIFHPAVIDSMFQTFALLSSEEKGVAGPILPKGVASVTINRPPQARMFVYSRRIHATQDYNHYSSLLLTPDGHCVAEVANFCTKAVKKDENTTNMLYGLKWKQKKLGPELSKRDRSANTSIILASNRFIEMFKGKCSTKEMCLVLEQTNNADLGNRLTSTVRIIVFAPFCHINDFPNDGNDIYQRVKQSLMQLQNVIRTVTDKKSEFKRCIIVVTENVIGIPLAGVPASNIIGAELWGMVRSAVHENLNCEFRLIDMKLTETNMDTLNTLLADHVFEFDECVISSGKTYFSELQEHPDFKLGPRKRVIPSTDDCVQLVSSASDKIEEPRLTNIQKEQFGAKTPNQEVCEIRIESICVHSSDVFPSSMERTDLFQDGVESGYPVMCLEGQGVLECGQRSSSLKRLGSIITFCYPVNVMTHVKIPITCVFHTNEIPNYTPGLITVCVVIWNLALSCKNSSKLTFITDQSSALLISVIKTIVSKHSKAVLTVFKCSSPSLMSEIPADTDTIILLGHVSPHLLMEIFGRLSSLKKLVSTEQTVSPEYSVWILQTATEITLELLNVRDMFKPNTLKSVVPKVFKKIRELPLDLSNKTQCRQTTDTRDFIPHRFILELPYPTLNISTSRNAENVILLQLTSTSLFRAKSCYIFVGGLTGLGWELLRFMAESGVKTLATISRQSPNDSQKNEIKKLQMEQNCKVIPLQADVTDMKQLQRAIATLKSVTKGHHIRGVFHGGGVIADRMLKDMTEKEIEQTLLPKVKGTWNLHMATLDLQLDFFVMHSSIVSVIGNPGQCNYSAGNAFEDSFAHYRKNIGLSAQTINWSAVSVGMAARNTVVEKTLTRKGLHFLTVDQIRLCFQEALLYESPQVMFGSFDWVKLINSPDLKISGQKFASLLEKYGTGRPEVSPQPSFDLDRFAKLESCEKQTMIFDIVVSKLSDIYVVNKDTLNKDSTVVQLGLDSFKAMTFVSEIADVTQVKIPIETLYSETCTMEMLSKYILEHLANQSTPASSSSQDESFVKEYFKQNVTFMQKSLLVDFIQDPSSLNLSRQVDFEIAGVTLRKKDWKIIFNHLLEVNPDLRRIYHEHADGSFSSIVLQLKDAKFDLEKAAFETLCEKNTVDMRNKITMDIRKDLPIRVMIAMRGDVTRIRMFVHAVLGDLNGIIMMFEELTTIGKCFTEKKPLPLKETSVEPCTAVQNVLSPKMPLLREFWREQLTSDILWFSFAKNVDAPLLEEFSREESMPVSSELLDKMSAVMNTHGISMFQFVASVYMILLYEKTGKDLIPLVTNIDMRSHVSQLRSYITRCTNAIPIVGDLRHIGSVSDYLRRSSQALYKMTENGAYPYELIEKEIKSETLKKYIGRHRLIMHNKTNLNELDRKDGYKVTLGNVFHKRLVYETTLYIVHDARQNVLNLQFAYNELAVDRELALTMLPRMVYFIELFVGNPEMNIRSAIGKCLFQFNNSNMSQRNTWNDCKDTDKETLGNVAKMKQRDSFLDSKSKPSNMDNQTLKTADGCHTFSAEVVKQPSQCLPLPSRINCGKNLQQNILRHDKFVKQTTEGWEHVVDLYVVARDDRLWVVWGSGKKLRQHEMSSISEIAVRNIRGMIYIVINTAEKKFTFKAPSRASAESWIRSFKEAVDMFLTSDHLLPHL